jgi:hypothetical protein
LLVFAASILPLAAAITRLKPHNVGSASWPPLGSVLLAALAFNLTFFWQELGLAIPKALTPGLSAVLYHNDHEWTGSSPRTELLQGTGAMATLASGLFFTAMLARGRWRSATWEVFMFWMAFQGLFQSLSQFAIGAVVPGNDVGRALGYLGLGAFAHAAVLVATLAAFALAGRVLAVLIPADRALRSVWGTRGCAKALIASGAALVLLSIPFRIPRNAVEVIVIPAIVTLMGVAWLLLGMTFVPPEDKKREAGSPSVAIPVAMLVALLLFFQCVLRSGIRLHRL